MLLLLIAELSAGAAWLLHASGLILLAGRIVNAWALSGSGRYVARTIGMMMTFTSLVLPAGLALF